MPPATVPRKKPMSVVCTLGNLCQGAFRLRDRQINTKCVWVPWCGQGCVMEVAMQSTAKDNSLQLGPHIYQSLLPAKIQSEV